jgi:hypothetical protein
MQEGFTFDSSGSGPLSQSIGNALTALIYGGFGYTNWDALSVDYYEGIEYMLVAAFGYVTFEDLAYDFKNGFVYIGQQAKLGLAQAFGYDSFVEFSTDLKNGFQYVINSIKSFLGISSPSTVFYQIAVSIVQGLIAGWNDTISLFLSTIGNTIEDIGSLFGIDLSGLLGGADASGLGTASSGTSGGTMGGSTATHDGAGESGVTNNYFYGTVYIGMDATGALQYDCPSPNPIMTSGSGSLVMNAV